MVKKTVDIPENLYRKINEYRKMFDFGERGCKFGGAALTWHKIIFGDCRNMSEIPDGSFPIEKSIKGILKDTVCGKARGSLNYCSHEKGHHYIYRFKTLLRVLCCIRRILKGDMPKDQICWTCYTGFKELDGLRE